MKAANEKKFTLITGASTGLGKALAEECARRGQDLLLVSLPKEQLPDLSASIRKEFGVEVHYYEADLTSPDEPFALFQWINQQHFSVNILINNAGIGGTMPLEMAPVAYIDRILQLNIRASSILTCQLIPELKCHRLAFILNVSSLLAFNPAPYKTVYPASKTFIMAFSRSLRAELRHTSVGVTILSPGPIRTNPDVAARIQLQGWLGRFMSRTPEYIARKAIRAMLRGNALVIPGIAGKLCFLLMKILPDGLKCTLSARLFWREVALQQNTGRPESKLFIEGSVETQ